MTLHVSALVGMFFSLLHCLFSFMNSMLSPLRPQAEPVQNWLPEMQSLVDSRKRYTVKNIYILICLFLGGGGCLRYIYSELEFVKLWCCQLLIVVLHWTTGKMTWLPLSHSHWWPLRCIIPHLHAVKLCSTLLYHQWLLVSHKMTTLIKNEWILSNPTI